VSEAVVIAILTKRSPPLSWLDVQSLAKEIVELIERERAEAVKATEARTAAEVERKSRSHGRDRGVSRTNC